jgi:heme/copper-type cytochrome/quinol oxidase subunit 2
MNTYHTKDELDQMQMKENNNFVFWTKLIFIVILVVGLTMIIIKYNKKEHKAVRYIGNSIIETPSVAVADSLISIK